MEPGLACLHAVQVVAERRQCILCSQYFSIICPQRIAGGGDNVGRCIHAGGQLLAQVITVVGGDPCGEPLAGGVVLAAQLGAAKAEKGGQHYHHAQSKRRRSGGKRCGQLCFQCG